MNSLRKHHNMSLNCFTRRRADSENRGYDFVDRGQVEPPRPLSRVTDRSVSRIPPSISTATDCTRSNILFFANLSGLTVGNMTLQHYPTTDVKRRVPFVELGSNTRLVFLRSNRPISRNVRSGQFEVKVLTYANKTDGTTFSIDYQTVANRHGNTDFTLRSGEPGVPGFKETVISPLIDSASQASRLEHYLVHPEVKLDGPWRIQQTTERSRW